MTDFHEAMRARRASTTRADEPAQATAAPRAGGGSTPYALAALNRETYAVATAPEGRRNHQLNTSAFSLYQLVAGGELPEVQLIETLTGAARQAGLGDHEIRATLRSAQSGKLKPRTAPELTTTPSAPVRQREDGALDKADIDTNREYLAQREYERQRAVADGKLRLKAEETADIALPDNIRLDHLLAEPDEPISYRVDRLWPVGGRIILAAQYKAGKTSMRDNLIRSLADGTPFLDNYLIEPIDGTICVLDFEMSRNMLRTWLREQGIRNPQRVNLTPLRGSVGAFDITSDLVRKRWVERLRQQQTQILILDCLGPVLASLGMDDDKAKDVGKFLAHFDALLNEAGIDEGLVIHHMGHSGERSRGSSRLRDWPDIEWKLVRERTDENNPEPPPDAKRFFSAFGRDVAEPESLIDWNPDTRRISLVGGNRKETSKDQNVDTVVDWVRDNPGQSQRNIEMGLAGQIARKVVRESLQLAIDGGRISVQAGDHNARIHYISYRDQNQLAEEKSVLLCDDLAATLRAEASLSHLTKSEPVKTDPDGALNSDITRTGPCMICGSPTPRFGPAGSPTCESCKRPP